jgi:hypothetical protein
LVVDVAITNTGRSPLRLTNWKSTGCACLQFLRPARPGAPKYGPPGDVEVGPGDTYTQQMEFSAKGDTYSSGRQAIEFESNDPRAPYHTVAFTYNPRGGLVVVPAEIDFGSVPPSGERTKAVTVYNADGRTAYNIARVEFDNPAYTLARINSLSDGSMEAGSRGRPVAEVEVRFRAGAADNEDLTATAKLHTAGGENPVLRIPLRARVRNLVRASPDRLYLPRYVGDAKQYTGRVLVRSEDGHPIALRGASAPDGVTCSYTPGKSSAVHWLTISVDPKVAVGAELRLVIEAYQGDKTIPVAVQVVCREDEP